MDKYVGQYSFGEFKAYCIVMKICRRISVVCVSQIKCYLQRFNGFLRLTNHRYTSVNIQVRTGYPDSKLTFWNTYFLKSKLVFFMISELRLWFFSHAYIWWSSPKMPSIMLMLSLDIVYFLSPSPLYVNVRIPVYTFVTRHYWICDRIHVLCILNLIVGHIKMLPKTSCITMKRYDIVVFSQ